MAFILSVNLSAQKKDFTRYVDPFIGTGGHGHTFPGATVPFGMVQLSPDTRIDNWDGSSGYHYSDSIIYGFSHTHLSGTGIPDYCDILFMPTIGEPQFEAKEGEKNVNGYASKFSHENEKAEPGYYSVKLNDDNIFAEMTATERVGFHRYTFPKTDEANIILDLKWRDKVENSKLKIEGNKIEGFRRSSSWAKDQIIYFVAEFSSPIKNVYVEGSEKNKDQEWSNKKFLVSESHDIKVAFGFNTEKNEQILLKVAISPVSIEGARKNLAAEIPDWNFEKVRSDAKAKWNKELSKIEVSGGTSDQMTNFYTALYHTMIAPNIFQDVDGNYLGMDRKILNIKDQRPKTKDQKPSDNYTIFSLWDTFRAAHPLYTIIDEKRTADFINTFIRHYQQGGRLPVWELAANETDTMIGYHAVPVIADAMIKDIPGVDYEKAFEAAVHSANLNHFGLEAYRRRGYISMEDEQESVSKTLEYAYDDACISQMALLLSVKHLKPENQAEMKKFNDYLALSEKFDRRSRSFENLFDPETGFMRPRQNGGFLDNFQPQEVSFHFTEGNSWVYTFFVPHNIPRLIDLMGGNQKFAAKLDELFTTKVPLSGRFQPDITGLIGQYAHGNEPSHHIAYLYNYVDEPWKTQKYIRKILDEFYRPEPNGLIGNEDCGQMSAWYILSASGFYPVSPNTSVYVLGTPIFPEVKYNLENGKTFTIKAPNVSAKNIYVRSATLNGDRLNRAVITHDDIRRGGTLVFEMADAPVKDAFGRFRNDFVDRINSAADNFVAVPIIEGADRSFFGTAKISLRTITDKASIFYTVDGSTPTAESKKYSGTFTVGGSTTVKAIAVDREGNKSDIAEAAFVQKPNDWSVKLFSKYNRQYTGGGDEGLIDGIRGTLNWASGEWQGYQGQDLVAVIDLKKETEIKKLGGGFLQDARPWIWMPTRIEFEISSDGEDFRKVAEIKTDVAPEDMKLQIKDYFAEIAPTKARFVRVKAYNLGKIPAWHPGAGSDAFIFVDEIFIK
ncbi:MAG: GH92 family glycosyl hydrolase [Pyrinomonadaceae bacterium]|nr:GH92 family glycosyl hydrolase [Pyrinomonadaceae bacterium]